MAQNFKEWTIEDIIKEMKESIGFPTGMKIFRNCILDEGNITISNPDIESDESTIRTITFGSGLKKTDSISLSPENDGSYEGSLVVESARNQDYAIGHIVSEPKLQWIPPSSTDADTLSKRLTAGYYRWAVVEINFTKLNELVNI